MKYDTNKKLADTIINIISANDNWQIDVDSCDSEAVDNGSSATFTLVKTDCGQNAKPKGHVVYTVTVTSQYQSYDFED